ncbi:MAG: rhodanese-like domain-containing protein [Proteobacteria bacterium]|nr:rhodanese-like domain-containing protein [Pseudomonadota bacterium]
MSRNKHPRPPFKGTFKAIVELMAALLQRKKYRLITKKELKQLLKSNDGITVVDCRDPKTYAIAGHIEGAVNLPYTEFMKNVDNIPTGKPVVAVCYIGAYSRAAAQKLANSGYRPVMSLLGGMEGWIDADYPVVRSKN